jgi:hypothetical protein
MLRADAIEIHDLPLRSFKSSMADGSWSQTISKWLLLDRGAVKK